MSVKEIQEAILSKKVLFGIKQVLKAKKTKKSKVFVASDAREETSNKLKENKIEFSSLKRKADVAKELNLGFECEVFLIK